MRSRLSIALSAILLTNLCQSRSSSDWRPWTADHTPDYKLVATAENTTINCLSRYSVIFNGTIPGPPLHMKENYTTWVRVYNNIEDQNLTVHWHGLSQRADIFSDGTPQVSQWPIAPFNYFDYAITPHVGDAGSYFYHSHIGMQALTASGVLIVDDIEADPLPYPYDHDISLLFQDFYNKNDSIMEAGLIRNPFQWTGEPEAILINGRSGNSSFSNASDATCTPEVIRISPGESYRIRLISNTALSFVTLGVEDHNNLTIIEADGEYTKPWSTDHIQIGSGQRFSLLFQAKSEQELRTANKTQFWLRYENRDRPTNVSGYALLQYELGYQTLPSSLPERPPVRLPTDRKNITTWSEYALESLNPASAKDFPTLSEVTRTVYVTMGQIIRDGFYNGSFHGIVQWAQNNLVYQTESSQRNNTIPYLIQVYTTGTTPNYTAALANNGWDPTSNNHAFPALVGEVLDIVWLSNSGPTGGWDFHPMHAHGAHYYDIGSGNGTCNATANELHFKNYTPAKRDTTMLHRYAVSGEKNTTAGWRAWRIRVTEDNVGAWMMHCHILAHMYMGSQTVWVFGDAASILNKFPVQPYVDGYLNFGGDAYGNESYDPFADGVYRRRR
ncbi:hypothetical protein LTR64_004110 [Lithohypha guttulata]|uniref:uncharacterized protein n=1 Tax=Lithohypha guttulata TaxID=1690604 RepID=UPI002DDFEF1A|nr:hypothetical protein LTR51_006597 [Lithohypha guttulata]